MLLLLSETQILTRQVELRSPPSPPSIANVAPTPVVESARVFSPVSPTTVPPVLPPVDHETVAVSRLEAQEQTLLSPTNLPTAEQSSFTRRAPPPPRPRHTSRSSFASQLSIPVSPSFSRTNSARSDADEDSDSDDEPDEEDEESKQRREAERLRVFEAAGLKIKVDAEGSARRQERRLAPSVPKRRPQSIVSFTDPNLSDVKRSDRPLPLIPGGQGSPSPPLVPRSPSPVTQTQDAYDRYVAFLEQQRSQPPPIPTQFKISPSAPPAPVLPPTPTTPGLLTSGISSLMNRIKTSGSNAGTAESSGRRPSSIIISTPISTSTSSSTINRTSTPVITNVRCSFGSKSSPCSSVRTQLNPVMVVWVYVELV